MKAEINLSVDPYYEVLIKYEGGQFCLAHTGPKIIAEKRAELFNSALSSHVQSELSKTNAGYWKKRCEAAEIIIQLYSQNPPDPFESLKALGEWNKLRSTDEPPSELSAK